ncbi:AraC family transcriptional regulator [Diplocloster hominis]|uniref:AraC family transcriptional regulator n=1 Tax=Diplocloster hominis TaxID=3079010 RepID=UPI0031BAE428
MQQYYKLKLETVVFITDIVNISYYALPKNYIFGGESHDFWEFVYVDKGELIITADSRRYLLKAGELVFHCPGEFHDLQTIRNSTANIVVVSFACDSPCMEYFRSKILFLNPFEKECLLRVVRESESAYEFFEKSAPRINMQKKPDAPFGSDQLLKTSLEQLFIQIYRRQDGIGTRERRIGSNALQNHAIIAQQVQTYIRDHYAQKLTLEILAAQVNISVSQLKRTYKDQTGSSVIAYLTKIRIKEAKRLIRESNHNFTQIAELTGYDNIYYFSRRFKEETQMTPTEYALSLKH